MPLYRVAFDVKHVHGSQVYLVKANSKEEALEKAAAAEDIVFESEDLEVQSLEQPYILDVVTEPEAQRFFDEQERNNE